MFQKFFRKSVNSDRIRGFTLIELLIVVAIILILIAIALPNFLSAQIRAKLTNAIGDLRTLETALESYRIQYTKYPDWTKNRVPGMDGIHPNQIRFYRLTTPIPFIKVVPDDPFATIMNSADMKQWGIAYDYIDCQAYPDKRDRTGCWGRLWRLNSWGPDGTNGWGGLRDYGVPAGCPKGYPLFTYSPTNGTNSKGDLVWVGPKDGTIRVNCYLRNGT
jgi:type II secretion system protein G